jgi:HSP20 family protein
MTNMEKLQQRAAGQREIAPPCDVYENDREILVVADLPGVATGDLNVQVDKNLLTVEARRDDRVRYQRAFSIPDTIDGAKIEARLDAGVLSVKLPKREAILPRKVQVRAG